MERQKSKSQCSVPDRNKQIQHSKSDLKNNTLHQQQEQISLENRTSLFFNRGSELLYSLNLLGFSPLWGLAPLGV